MSTATHRDLYPNRANAGIIGLHEDSPKLYEQQHAFWAVVNRQTRRIIAGPFDTQGKASSASGEAQRRGFDTVIVSYPAKAAQRAA